MIVTSPSGGRSVMKGWAGVRLEKGEGRRGVCAQGSDGSAMRCLPPWHFPPLTTATWIRWLDMLSGGGRASSHRAEVGSWR
ncbi:hypothetical protein V6N12_033675 [Hibiscus sabdariffa]|uniref:Uncharacterized protein n=1 Tax=Hibiscus sabdariffa TaxID=183260 RepID=A0ABR2AP48_9ROSI